MSRGADVRILSLRAPANDPRHEVLARARLLEKAYYDEASYRAALARFRPHLFHAHFALQATAKARELARDTGLPFTFTAHGYDIWREPPPDLASRAAAAAAVLTVSEANALRLETLTGIPRAGVHVVPCGIDVERFAPSGAAVAGEILSVARLVPVKCHGQLLKACGILRARGVDFRCTLLGEGVSRDEVELLLRLLRLHERVSAPGAVDQDEVLRRWRRASVGVLTSSSEGMPVSLMEAAACAVPVVATRVGGVPEVVEDGVTGILVPPGDTIAIADAVEALLRDPERRRAMGEEARHRAVERFSVARQVDRLLDVWDGVLRRK